MGKLTKEEEQRYKELKERYLARKKLRDSLIRTKLNEAQTEFITKSMYYGDGVHEPLFQLGSEMYRALKNGAKPSEYLRKNMRWLFDSGYIPPKYRDALLWAVDSVTDRQFATSYYRRSFRSREYFAHFTQIHTIIRDFGRLLEPDISTADALTLRMPEDYYAYIQTGQNTYRGYTPETIAYALDHGDTETAEALKDILSGEGRIDLSFEILYGIVRSHNTEMHEYLCKLLCAARLQEGLRQSICESADAGTPEAFRMILQTIQQENLIRFSSVRRAVGTWTGLMTFDPKALDRVSEKTLAQVIAVLDSEETRTQYLHSEDSMEIYMALWGYGFYEITDAMQKIRALSERGSHHQILTAGYFLANIDNADFSHETAKQIILLHSAEQEIMAVTLPYLMSDWHSVAYRYGINKYDSEQDALKHKAYFADEQEAEQFWQILSGLLAALPKKDPVFSPCVFPWYSAELSRKTVIARLALIAMVLNDPDKIDAAVRMLPQADANQRSILLRLLLRNPQTEVQRAALTEALCDKESSTRGEAFKLISASAIQPGQYRIMEDLLRYKAADARANLIALLLGQPDDLLFESITRLLSDAKEEKRTAALDLMIQVCGDDARRALAEKCRNAAAAMESPTGREQILLSQILGEKQTEAVSGGTALFTDADLYRPVLKETDYLRDSNAVFLRYFPDTQIFAEKKGILRKLKAAVSKPAECGTYREAVRMLRVLEGMLRQWQKREFTNYGEAYTVDCYAFRFYVNDENGRRRVPFYTDWEKWYDDSGCTPEQLERMCTAIDGGGQYAEQAELLFGQGFSHSLHLDYADKIRLILNDLCHYKIGQDTALAEETAQVAYALLWWSLHALPRSEWIRCTGEENGKKRYTAFFRDPQVLHRVMPAGRGNGHFQERFDLRHMIAQEMQQLPAYDYFKEHYYHSAMDFIRTVFPQLRDYIIMTQRGCMTESMLMKYLFDDEKRLGEALSVLSAVNGFIRDAGVVRSKRGSYYAWRASQSIRFANELLGYPDSERRAYTEEQRSLLTFAADLFDRLMQEILPAELHRGDTAAKYSGIIRKTSRIYGLDNFLAILQALGKDTLERSTYIHSDSKKSNLSYLLSVCIPNDDDTAEQLAEKIRSKDISVQRLIEAALYAPEWLPIIDGYLKWDGFISGCYYFMAHMNEQFDDRRRAMIAKYTPLTEEELNLGAFDIEWFRSAYETLGKKRFQQIYDAAKYISDGSKHSRARKYADAVEGKLDPEKTEQQIGDKRNKDLVMAYALIPFADESELSRRYLRIVQYRKEAKQFGAQRSASERKAADIALQNLAMNAGFSDVTRLTLRMETKLLDDSKIYFDGIAIDDITLKLETDADGKVSISVTKDGKALKAVPAKYKKHPDVIVISETKKKLTEQYRRTRDMLEQAMEEQTVWQADELQTLLKNPVAAPVIGRLVYAQDGHFGFLRGDALVSAEGAPRKLHPDDALTVAHPFDLWKANVWQAYQAYCFREKIVQPFKQVFRELYVKTAEEAESPHSLRYAGNQIQPKKTVACLKSRRWVADVEDGLQKVFYQENLVAAIYAMADWFSPADIEAPTLEYVAFFDRKTGMPKPISEVPDVLFSEVMRDVDMAVSVAHAGGVDPETSHSTVEMRAALLALSMPLLKMKNVTVSGSHAHIEGSRSDYTVHLGSGVVHVKGGTMLNILPVHSQHRGRIFLPFADDDPKTAEILSKILLLSEDSKIKDPAILSQL